MKMCTRKYLDDFFRYVELQTTELPSMIPLHWELLSFTFVIYSDEVEQNRSSEMLNTFLDIVMLQYCNLLHWKLATQNLSIQ